MRIPTSFASVLISAALLAALSGCGQGQQAGGPPPAGEPEVAVVTIAPQRTTLTTVLPGRTSPYLVSDVRPQVGGIVQKRLFKEGSEVKVGEALYQIDPATYQAAYDSAKAALARAEANALPARLKAERFGALVKVRGVSQQDNDDAQATHRQAEAEVLSAKAALETARINLSYTRVSSPISGRIGKSSVTPGALVTGNQAAVLATVQQTDPIYVDVTQSSSEVLRMKRDLASGKLKKAGADGAKVKLLFDDGTAYAQEGALQFSDITVDQSTGVVTLRAVFPNPGHELLPGLYVRAVLEEGVEEQALLVPQPAVSRDTKGNAMVMVVKDDGVVEPRPITVGRVVGDKWLITSGLNGGERVIVEGLQKAKPGAKVKAVEAGAPAPAPAGAAAAGAPAGGVQQNGTQPSASQSPPAPAAPAAPAQTPKPEAAKPVAPKAELSKAVAAKAPPEKAVTDKAPAKAERGVAYSPPKSEPWPASTLHTKPDADQQPAQN